MQSAEFSSHVRGVGDNAACVGVSSQARPGSCRRCTGECLAAVSRLTDPHRHFLDHDSARAEAGLGLGRRRSVRFIRRHCRWRGLRRHRDRRVDRRRPDRRQVAVAIQGRRSDWGIVAHRGERPRLHRRSDRRRARGEHRRRQAGLDLQDAVRGEVIAGRDRRPPADRLVRRQLVRPRCRHREAGVDLQDGKLRARHAVDRQRRRAFRGVRRSVSRRGREDRQGTDCHLRHRLHRRVGGAGQQRRLLRHVRQPGAGARSWLAQGAVALRASRSQVPVLFVGRGGGRHGGAGRARSHGARARCEDRQGALDAHDAGAH